jgi:murein DD-endopeptidase MepM/ murein hydrolase activator NlpD
MRIQKREIAACVFGVITVVAPFFLLNSVPVSAQSLEQLQREINERSNRLQEIEKEIAKYQLELQKVGAEKSTLQKAINQLELERKKVEADIAYTQNKIGATDAEISKLTIEIGDTENSIEQNEEAIRELLRRLNEAEEDPLIISMLRHENLAEFWDTIETIAQVRNVMGDEIRSLAQYKTALEEQRSLSADKREDLVALREQYLDQNKVLQNNKAEKNTLLQKTKNEEAEYQRLLAEKQAARAQIEKELRDFESKLQFILDPDSIPSAGTAVFNWPVANVVITQYFGGTEFAKRNASVYGGRAYHPGVDFGVPSGTKIYAPLAGVVRATGNTDLVAGCYSWGKWTLIDHANGLSTLYAHQSVISVVPGQEVATGEVIGYTGNTGYSTGPHLHFTVYAKAGVSVRRFNEIKTVTSCGAATTPVAATDAYLDPMLYLPKL